MSNEPFGGCFAWFLESFLRFGRHFLALENGHFWQTLHPLSPLTWITMYRLSCTLENVLKKKKKQSGITVYKMWCQESKIGTYLTQISQNLDFPIFGVLLFLCCLIFQNLMWIIWSKSCEFWNVLRDSSFVCKLCCNGCTGKASPQCASSYGAADDLL